MFSQRDPPSGVKKQVPSVRDMAVQVDQPQHTPVKVPPGQLSRTSSVKSTAMQADLPQQPPVSPRADDHQQTKDNLQVPKEAPDALSDNQQSAAQDKIYVMV